MQNGRKVEEVAQTPHEELNSVFKWRLGINAM
jgi:hypothetical protein